MSQKPSTPKGTRDILPEQMMRRNYIFDHVKSVFKRYGYVQIETPSFEKRETLMGKYGEEGDRLIFKILNSGDKVKKADLNALEQGNLARFSNSLAEKALRYDLTVPFARFVVQHKNELHFPFKRFQIQPVWRADRPQKGRYQEFFQCDADVVGSDSLLHEVDFIQIFDEVLTNLHIPNFVIKLNNRKVLAGVAEVCGESDRIIQITVAIDKLDKIGIEGVQKELLGIGLAEATIEKMNPLFNLNGSFAEKLDQMNEFLSSSEIGQEGLRELQEIKRNLELLDFDFSVLDFDVTLARGLNYYTGAIFEVGVKDVKIGSICGGGRYDDLTGMFGMKDLSGVGISFGADRIYDVLEELDLFPSEVASSTKLLFTNFGTEEQDHCLKLVAQIRKEKIDVELYPEQTKKMNKQMKYANDKAVPFVALVGEDEIAEGKITLKNMETGEHESLSLTELIQKLK